MIFSEQTIRRSVDDEEIVIEPEPMESQFQPASLDVRLGPKLYDVLHDQEITDWDDGEVVLEPGRQYIGHTRDYIELPNDVAAMIAGRSSVGRDGVIIHKTAGWIDPGFQGQLTLELYNFSPTRQTFDVGSRVGQLVFFYVDCETDGYDGQYQHQMGPTKHE